MSKSLILTQSKFRSTFILKEKLKRFVFCLAYRPLFPLLSPLTPECKHSALLLHMIAIAFLIQEFLSNRMELVPALKGNLPTTSPACSNSSQYFFFVSSTKTLLLLLRLWGWEPSECFILNYIGRSTESSHSALVKDSSHFLLKPQQCDRAFLSFFFCSSSVSEVRIYVPVFKLTTDICMTQNRHTRTQADWRPSSMFSVKDMTAINKLPTGFLPVSEPKAGWLTCPYPYPHHHLEPYLLFVTAVGNADSAKRSFSCMRQDNNPATLSHAIFIMLWSPRWLEGLFYLIYYRCLNTCSRWISRKRYTYCPYIF